MNLCEFLEKIRGRNPDKTLIILDNFKSHWAKKTRENAKELDIVLVYLPPYSPDLNPIEQIRSYVRYTIIFLLTVH